MVIYDHFAIHLSNGDACDLSLMFSGVTSEVPASVADDLFVNTEDDHYAPMEDKVVEAVIAGASSHEDEPNEPCINNVFIGKNLNQELEKGFKDWLLKK